MSQLSHDFMKTDSQCDKGVGACKKVFWSTEMNSTVGRYEGVKTSYRKIICEQ